MWNKLKKCITEMESIDYGNLSIDEKQIIKQRLLTMIGFFQHERLIHLIVTVSFALLTMLGIILINITNSITSIVLVILFFVLLIPYLVHYYRLENGVQKLYEFYDKL